ncbi:hypothetical protein [Sulfitobacter mediterraneus]|uniref:hypothetical protein n=1 Tax=Sulfitobacter mediterraneus TaxID=83219 RepID=UPI000EA0B545|nr:hypothetical protein [Sulfitobacter mediterraneus]
MVEIVNANRFTAIGPAIAQVKEDHEGQYMKPVWGTKNTENMKNLGFVIGYEDEAKRQWFRVDYDPNPDKGLHLNWEQDTRDSVGSKTRLKECYLIRPHIIHPEDEMYTWWRSTTLHHCTDLPDDIRDKMGGKHIWRGAFWS